MANFGFTQPTVSHCPAIISNDQVHTPSLKTFYGITLSLIKRNYRVHWSVTRRRDILYINYLEQIMGDIALKCVCTMAIFPG